LDGNGKALVSPSLAGEGTIASEPFEDRMQHLPLSTHDVDGSTVITVADVIAYHLIGIQPMSGPRTLQDGYGPPDLTTEAGRRRERFLSLNYNGIPFADHPIQYRNNDPTEVGYSKEMAEAVSFGHLAVGAGIDHLVSNIENRKPPEPDLRVILADGADVWVEVGQVTESASAKYFSAIQKVNQHLRRLENADAVYLGEIQGRHVSVQLPSAPPAAQSEAAADEIVTIMRSIDFDTARRKVLIRVDPTVAPYLASLGANYYIGDGISTYVRANNGANAFNPDDTVTDFKATLEIKMGKSYEVNGPLWLAMPLTDLRQVPMLSLEAIRRRVFGDTGQFNRVLVGMMEDALILDKNGAA